MATSPVGMIVMDVGNPFYAAVVRGAEDAAAETGRALLLGNADDSDEKERRYLQAFDDQDVAGIVVSPVKGDLRHLELFHDRGIEIVVIERTAGEELCSVSVDDAKGGEFAVRHLLSLGHERVAVITGPATGASAARVGGGRAAFEAAGVDPAGLTEVRVGGFTFEDGALAAERLRSKPEITAAFCVNDLLAAGLLSGTAEQGRRVPEDLAVVGYDDIPLAGLLPTPLTTIRQPMYGLGHTAMRLLLDEIDNAEDHKYQAKVFTPSLIVRASTAP